MTVLWRYNHGLKNWTGVLSFVFPAVKQPQHLSATIKKRVAGMFSMLKHAPTFAISEKKRFLGGLFGARWPKRRTKHVELKKRESNTMWKT